MPNTYLERSVSGLPIRQPGREEEKFVPESTDPSWDSSLQDAGKKFIHCFAVPPAIHIGLAETNGSFAESATVGFRIMDLQIPGLVSTNAYISVRQQRVNLLFVNCIL
jgi:hypothetical protein